jgi:hypothetical protein
MTQWDYEYTLVRHADFGHHIKVWGDDGWEMCGVVDHPESKQYSFFWKRPRPSSQRQGDDT